MARGSHEKQHWKREERIGPRCQSSASSGWCGFRIRLSAGRRRNGRCDYDLLIRPDHKPHVQEHDGADRTASQNRNPVGALKKFTALLRPLHQHVKPSDYDRSHCAPSKPPERTRHQFLDRAASNRRLSFGEERSLDEIEIVKQPDPCDSEQEVKPPQHYVCKFHRSSFSMLPLVTGRIAYGSPADSFCINQFLADRSRVIEPSWGLRLLNSPYRKTPRVEHDWHASGHSPKSISIGMQSGT